MLDTLTEADFLPLVGQPFVVPFPAQEVKLVLVDVQVGQAPSGGRFRTPFRLHFAGPGSPALPQRIYPLRHAAFGEIGLFIVPVGRTPDGIEYESVFG